MAVYQGTFGSILSDMQLLLRLADDDLVTSARRWANIGYIDAVQRTECFQRTSTAAMTDGVDSYDIPDRVLTVKKLTIVYADGSTSRPLKAVDLGTMLEMRQSTTAAGQEAVRPYYTLVGDAQLEVWPTPGAGQQLVFWYVRYPDALVEDEDEPEIREPFGSNLICYGGCVVAARFKKDPLLGEYEGVYASWIDRFQAHLNRGRGIGQFVIDTAEGFFPPHDPSSDLYVTARIN